ncbi:hypothetical protein MMC28_007006 [Mycoblastus sanguinarius]|nr:hypothetical protein [Mycoblastus sanguinarius]
MPCYSGDQFRKDWVYAIEKDFQSADGTPATWATGQPAYWGEEHASIPLPCSPATACLNADSSLLAVALEHDIHIYSISDLKVLQILKGHVSRVDALRFHPKDSRTLVSCAMNNMGGSVKAELTIIYWNLDEQRRLALLSEDKIQGLGKRAVEGVTRGLEDVKSSWTMNEEEKESLRHEVGKAVTTLNIKSQVRDNIEIHGGLFENFGSQTFNASGTSMAFLPGKRPRSNGDDKWDICIWDTVKKETRLTLEGHRDAIMWVGFSPDDKLLASVSWDKTFRIWSHENGDLLHTFESNGQNWTGGFSKDSRFFAGTSGEGRFWIWDMAHGLEVVTHEFGGQGRWCRTLDWNPDGKQLVIGGSGLGRIIVFELKSQAIVQERGLSTEKCPKELQRMAGSWVEVSSAQYLPDKDKFAFKMTGDSGLEIYDVAENKKWRFAPKQGENKGYGGGFLVLEQKGLIASVDAEAIRFWKVPVSKQA